MRPLESGDPTSVGGGRYRLVGRLGQGGMGVVYLGRSRSGRAVAVKVVRPELSTDPEFRRRFAGEVAAARRVGGFHTAPVVDADPDGEPAWLVTAFVPGPTLQSVLAQVGALPADTLVVLAAGLAEALEAIHRAGVIHRDLKPANIIIAQDGPRVIDFGIARALDGTALTQTGLQIGTPGFLAPEQLTGGTVTPAADMFALGVVLSQSAGAAPFGDGPSVARHYRVVHQEPDLGAVPAELRGPVAACLAKDPRDRPTPTEFLGCLTIPHLADGDWLPDEATRMLRRDPVASSAPPQDAVPASEAFTATPTAAEPPRSPEPSEPLHEPTKTREDDPVPPADPVPRGRNRRGRLAGAAGLLVVAAAAGLLVWQPWGGGSSSAATKGGGHPAKSSSSPAGHASPAPFPTTPLLVRADIAPGWPLECHGVIARRAPTEDVPLQLVAVGKDACDTLPQLSPDHKSIAFTRRDSHGAAVWVASADGTGARRVADIVGGRASWSPDGTRLAVLRHQSGVQQLFVVNVSDGSAQQITTGRGWVEDPAWSPDGSHIAVCLQDRSGNWQINLVDPASPGTPPRQVTDLPTSVLDPVWSPDGRHFAYTSGKYGTGTQGDIHVIGADGTGDRVLVATDAHEMDPAWTADGKWLAFVRGPYGQPAVWAVRADGTGERKLTTGSLPEGQPAWD